MGEYDIDSIPVEKDYHSSMDYNWGLTEEQRKKYYALLEIDRDVAGDYFDKCLHDSIPKELRERREKYCGEGDGLDDD